MTEFKLEHITYRRRYAWWPVELWGGDEGYKGVKFKGVYLWKKVIVEMNTISHGWRAYERIQDLRPEE